MTSSHDDWLRRVISKRAFEHDDEDVTVHASRELFFRAVHRIKPLVVGELMYEPLALYRPLFEMGLASVPEEKRLRWHALAWFPSWGRIKYASAHDMAEVHELRERLYQWAEACTEGLRSIARDLGASHETIRTIVHRVRE